MVCNTASIDHIQIGSILKFPFLKTRFRELLSDGTAFGKVEFAPQGIKGHG
jgi:hypothetical protein